MSRCLRHSLATLLLGLLPAALPADWIVLKNGQRLEGIVSAETDQGIVLNVAGGNIRFTRAQIQSVHRTAAVTNQALAAAWRDKRFLEKESVPPGMEDLAEGLRRLETRRRAALAARDNLARSEETMQRLDQSHGEARTAFVEVNAALESATPGEDPRAYNTLVASNNALRAVVVRRQAELENEWAQRPRWMASISDYLAAFQAYSQSVVQVRSAPGGATGDTGRFLEKVEGFVSGYAADFRQSGIQTRVRGNATLVEATINGRALGSFLVDTGAETLTLSRAFAERAGVDVTNGVAAGAVLADGRRIEAAAVRLASVKLGSFELRNVNALVLPLSPGEGLDGLLGMNVLKSFLVRIDPATGRLLLDRFDPH